MVLEGVGGGRPVAYKLSREWGNWPKKIAKVKYICVYIQMCEVDRDVVISMYFVCTTGGIKKWT